MMEFFAYLICCLGVTYAWTDTEVATPFRNIVARIPYISRPMLCHECSSFWFALGISFLLDPLDGAVQLPFASHILDAFCGFFVNLLFARNKFVAYKD
jgi:hypothetical protein